MKTYPILRNDGSLHAFEISNMWISMSAIKTILRSVGGVTSLKRQLRSDDRLIFIYQGTEWVVNEPWGDSSRYWIGPKNALDHQLSVSSIHDAFVRYRFSFASLVKPERPFRFACFTTGAILVAISLWSLLWVFSSSDLAFTACNGSFSLFASTFRCRQPHIAGLVFLCTLLLAIVAFRLGVRNRE